MSFQPCHGISQGATARRPRSRAAEASSGEVPRFAAGRSVFRSFKYRTLGMRQLWLYPFSVQFDNASIVPPLGLHGGASSADCDYGIRRRGDVARTRGVSRKGGASESRLGMNVPIYY